MSLTHHELIKAVSGGVTASVIGHYLSYGTEINSEYLKYSLMFGGVVTGGLFAAGLVTPNLVAQQSGNTQWFSTKTLQHRAIEVGLDTTAVVLFNRYVSMTTPQSMIRTAGIVLASDFIGEYIADYCTQQPLSYFA
jgi:hypothetical protein